MKKQRSYLRAMMVGMLLGMAFLTHGKVEAAGNGGVTAYPTRINIMVDGQPTEMEAYGIDGSTFVRLVDVGKAVDFNVYWDAEAQSVCLESTNAYTGQAPTGWSRNRTVSPERQEIVDRTNAARKREGLNRLDIDEMLMEAAQVRATEMAAATLYAHVRPDGSAFHTVTDCPYVGENIHRISQPYLKYYGLELAETAVEDWLDSDLHRENLLRPDTVSIGVGIAKGVNDNGETAWYCVQLFMVNGGEIHRVADPVLK